MKAVIYARYSSDSQREESIEGQLRECTAFAEKNGITVLRRLSLRRERHKPHGKGASLLQVRFSQKEAHGVPQEACQEGMDRGFGGR
ncbi:recombinase family protein [Flavonifractor plautii]|uniref:recombinase family protein n=1 Tax=Flavonifractor plautii TaxID=292800 RepID=UPI0023304E2A|nr:recombinase family protein [Flavonifractor plautii]MDB7881304.1 recombinase family protein [Flavonifractor plautii]